MAGQVQSAMSKASRYAKAGDVDAALGIYDGILAAFPGNRRAQVAKARLQQVAQDPDRDVLARLSERHRGTDWRGLLLLCRDVLKQHPKSERVWTYCGAAALNLGDTGAAIAAFLRAVEISRSAQGLKNLGAAFEAGGLHARAAEVYAEALSLAPNTPDLRFVLGQAQLLGGDLDGAAATLAQLVQGEPSNAAAQALLGEARLQSGQTTRAVEAFSHAARLAPREASHFNNLSVALRASGQRNAALAAAREAIALTPDSASAYQNLGNLYADAGNLPEAIAAYERAVALEPERHATLAQKLHFQHKLCDWTGHSAFSGSVEAIGVSGEAAPPFPFLAFEDNPARQRQRSERFAQRWHVCPRPEQSGRSGKLRVGYVSSDFFAHATLQLLNGVIEQHDRTAFEIYAYSLNAPSDGPEIRRFKGNVDMYRDVHALSDRQVVELIRADALDIAIDLKGYTENARTRLFAEGLAPVHISYLGYPGTLGGDVMDYIIADRVVIPDTVRSAYAEHVIYLPDSYQPNDDARYVPVARDRRADHGLSEDAFVLCCFNNSYKITPDVFDIWMRLLRTTADAQLWLLDAGPEACRNLRREAADRGVAPERLVFAPRVPNERHLARHGHADLFVDTFPCTAHTTASDALWAGLPVVTRAGRQFAARVGASLLQAVGLPELVCSDAATYEAVIASLMADRAQLATTRQKLAEGRLSSPLFDTVRYTRHFEDGLRQATAACGAGRLPRDIHVLPRPV